MKLHIFICILFFFHITQAAGNPKDTIISIEDPAWELTERSFTKNGSALEKYHHKNGPQKLPLEFYICSCLISFPCCCCCSRSIKEYLTDYEHQSIQVSDRKRKIFKKYYIYAKPNT